MKSISNTLMDHFLVRGIVDKKYQFLNEVKFMSPSNKLKIGDIFTENGFMSTTRDTFYKCKKHKYQ